MGLQDLETPEAAPVEAPVAESVVENQETETPVAEPQGEETVSDEKAVETKTPEKTGPNYQHNYDTAISMLGDYLPKSQVSMFKADLKGRVHGDAPPEKQPQSETNPAIDSDKSIIDMTEAELMAVVSKSNKDSVQQALEEYENRRNAKEEEASYEKEVNVSERAFKEFLDSGKFTPEDEQKAYDEVGKLGLDIRKNGNYAMATRLMMKELVYIAQGRGRIDSSVNDAIDKNQELLNTIQPTAAAATDAPTLSDGDKFIEGLKKIKKTRLSDLESS